MRRFLAFSLLFLLVGSALGIAAAAAPSALRLPIVGVQASVSTTITTLIPDDSTFVNAVFIDGAEKTGNCTILSYIDRAHGNRLHIVRDAGDHVVEVELPPVVQSIVAPAPSFDAPGDKQADGTLMIRGAALVLYYTSRDADDPTGPFKLKRLEMPLPSCA